MYSCCHSLKKKNNSLAEFSVNIACQETKALEKRKDTWIYEEKKCKEHLKPAEACEARRRDSTEFGVVDETTTTKFARWLAQYTVSHFRSSSTKSSSWFLNSLIIACRDANRIVFKTNTINMKLSIWQRVLGTRDLDHLPSGNTEEVS